mmetsp:Transcript_24729/g.71396  ORF Transcript_24729/g.71396 Transcript_24729/m.71396 type:complete len:131 (-) Transcript_24729:190-582(-)
MATRSAPSGSRCSTSEFVSSSSSNTNTNSRTNSRTNSSNPSRNISRNISIIMGRLKQPPTWMLEEEEEAVVGAIILSTVPIINTNANISSIRVNTTNHPPADALLENQLHVKCNAKKRRVITNSHHPPFN